MRLVLALVTSGCDARSRWRIVVFAGNACGHGSQAPAVLQHRDHRESGFGALVTAAPAAGEAVAAPAGPLVDQRNLDVVVAEEPGDAHSHAGEPSVVAGNRGRAHAGVR